MRIKDNRSQERLQTLVHIPDTDVVGAVSKFEVVTLTVVVLRLESAAFTKRREKRTILTL